MKNTLHLYLLCIAKPKKLTLFHFLLFIVGKGFPQSSFNYEINRPSINSEQFHVGATIETAIISKIKFMKDIERLFNRLNFGLFFPVWYIDCILRTFFAQVCIWIAKRSLSEEIFEKRNKNWEKSQNFMNDMQLYCNYNIIDVFVGFSVMAMMLVLWDVFQDVVEHNLLNIFSKRFIGIILFVTIFIVAYVPAYYFFHRHDKRKKYFIEFDKEPMNQKWKWSAISIAVYVGIWAFVIILHHWYAK